MYKLSDINEPYALQYMIEDIRYYKGFNTIDCMVEWYISNYKFITFACEVVRDTYQKLRFDIDKVDNNSEEVLKYIITKIKKNIPNGQIKLYAIGITSFHIVINKIYFENSEQVKLKALEIISKIPLKYSKYIDKHVYNKIQFFRMLGSTKPNEYRYKWDISGKSFDNIKDSLLSCIDNCSFYNSNLIYTKPQNIKITYNNKLNKQKIIFYNKIEYIDIHYKIRSQSNNLILLDRLQGSFCNLCSRFHEHENPYILIINSSFKFCCRRTNQMENILFE
jgi:hypothetical protein